MTTVSRTLLLALLAVGLVTFMPADRAFACSCVEMTDLPRQVEEADAAVVGVVTEVERDPGSGRQVHTIRVEYAQGVAGQVIKVESNLPGGSCGIETFGEERLGLLLGRRDGEGWASNLCSQVDPVKLSRLLGDPDVQPARATTVRGQSGWWYLGVFAGAFVVIVAASVILGAVWWRARGKKKAAAEARGEVN